MDKKTHYYFAFTAKLGSSEIKGCRVIECSGDFSPKQAVDLIRNAAMPGANVLLTWWTKITKKQFDEFTSL